LTLNVECQVTLSYEYSTNRLGARSPLNLVGVDHVPTKLPLLSFSYLLIHVNWPAGGVVGKSVQPVGAVPVGTYGCAYAFMNI